VSQHGLLQVDFSEADALGEASEEASFQLQFWKDFSFWDSDAIDRNVSASMSARTSGILSERSCDDWLTRKNVFVDDWGNVIKFPSFTRKRSSGEISISTLEEWECLVSDVGLKTVFADSKPLIENIGSKVLMEVPIREFSKKDRVSIKPGMVFRYIMCWTEKANGTRSRESFVYVRRPLRNASRNALRADEVASALDLLSDSRAD